MLAKAGFRVDVSIRAVPEGDVKAVEESVAVRREVEARRAAGTRAPAAARVPA